ncbi:helix-turn-helix domain-containing protein [uncultured Dokdonia sp.]|uniref:helix-turn-helix domain-containing protein n=1 Tax=uncultured Dokdonia sp. TaxID=575653 RepID=UPI00262A7F14|nr:helix-turn-helix domain-containing protein [uncultured Dokdonia sp.]
MIYLLTQRSLYLYIFFIVFISQNIFAQEKKFVIPDSLKDKSYQFLFDKAQQNLKDTITARVYLHTFLAKAIHENNSLRKINGHTFLSYLSDDKDKKLYHVKKALLEEKNVEEKEMYSTYTYAGTVYDGFFDYELALKNYIKALKIAEKYNDKNEEYILFNNIAKIKESIGKHEEALTLYKKCFAYEVLKNDTIGQISTTLSLARSMRYNKKHDSATYYYNTIIDRANRDRPLYGDIITINEGINLFYKNNYPDSEKLIKKGSSQIDITIESQGYYILAQLYLGKIQIAAYSNNETAKKYFIKVDSLVSEQNAIIPSTIDAYEFLINYYEEKGDLKKQLDIINKLYQIRTTISSRKINTIDMLYSDFDTPQLLKSKENIIKKLELETTTLTTRSIYLIIFILFLIILFLLQFSNYKKQKNRFNKIVLELDNQSAKIISKPNSSIKEKTLLDGVDEATITGVINKLNQFEGKKGFLQKDITLTILAKKCATNTKYLPKIISAYKGKSFVNYINHLRIDYILKELKENAQLKKYTIKTISEEAGFNTPESFARAFKNKTGIRPSYYIRSLEKVEKIKS